MLRGTDFELSFLAGKMSKLALSFIVLVLDVSEWSRNLSASVCSSRQSKKCDSLDRRRQCEMHRIPG